MQKFTHTLEVDTSRSEVFSILDDVGRTPEWLNRCTGVDKLSDGPNAVGTQLKYHYKDGSRTGEMDGRITAYEPEEHIAMLYTDSMMDVSVDFVATPGPVDDSTRLTHTIDIRTKGLARLFWPIIKVALPRQTTEAMARLKRLAEVDSD